VLLWVHGAPQVQFSNHTQYGQWEGLPTPTEQIGLLARGIEAVGALGRCDAVLSGYLGTEEQGAQVLDVVARVKAANPKALYVCDPVMGHPAKGCVVPTGVQEHHAKLSAAAADVLCPNVLELGVMAGCEPRTPAEVLEAAKVLLSFGDAQCVLVKHLAHAGLAPDDAFGLPRRHHPPSRHHPHSRHHPLPSRHHPLPPPTATTRTATTIDTDARTRTHTRRCTHTHTRACELSCTVHELHRT
jgi:pyridoxal/pyridoxine/pyridoxamine kinase